MSPASQSVDVAAGSFAELSAFFREEMELKLEQLRKELTPTEAITAEQLAAFQARIGALHSAQLLSDDELYALEDLIGDFCDLRESVAPQVLSLEVARSTPGDSFAVVGKLRKLAAAAETFTADAALARQLRRRLE
eukprot:COSAG03_NODE_10129_length_670_cov_1.112084_1_plen_136_part_00